MEVRAKKALGQHFLTDQSIAQAIVRALREDPAAPREVLEIGPGMGVLTQYLIKREDLDPMMIEIDTESVEYLLTHFNGMQGRLIEGDYLKLNISKFFKGSYRIIGNFPYNISSQIFFKILDDKDRVPEVVCMIQKEVADRIAEKPGSKTYGILSVLLQAWYDIEYVLAVGPGAFSPPPKVRSAVIRLTRNSRTELGCDERLFKAVVKTAFNQRRKTLRNALKPLFPPEMAGQPAQADQTAQAGQVAQAAHDAEASSDRHPLPDRESFFSDPVFDLRAERLGVEDFIALTKRFEPYILRPPIEG